MKIIFMGTPEFAVPICNELAKKHEIVLVCTQPDVYNYKKKEMVCSPVKKWAIENNVEVFQPEKIKVDYQKVIDTECDLIVTAAYGQFIGNEVLNHPRLKAINVHGSLLPKYRGGAPIQRSIISGEKETGITIIYMVSKMDAGDMLYQEKIKIEDTDNQDTIFEKLSILGSKAINKVCERLENDLIKPIPQNEEDVTFAYNLTKEDEHLDFSKSARDVFNQIRGLNSNPGAYLVLDDLNIKVYNSKVSDKHYGGKEALIVGINKDSFDISCKDGSVISILEIQLPSKKKMLVKDFINGQGRKLLAISKEIK